MVINKLNALVLLQAPNANGLVISSACKEPAIARERETVDGCSVAAKLCSQTIALLDIRYFFCDVDCVYIHLLA